MVMAHALLRDLRLRDAAVVIDVLAPEWSLPLLGRMPEVRRGIALPVRHGELALNKRLAVARAMRTEHYTQAIVLPRSAKAALVPFLARIPRRTGFRGELRYGLINDVRPFDREALDQTVKRFRALGVDSPGTDPGPLLPPQLEADPVALQSLLDRHRLVADAPVAALMPGAEYGPAKQWPAERFRELARALAHAGYRVWILGSEREAPLGRLMAEDLAGVTDLCGRTSLVDAVDLLSAARVAVSNDSGLMHVAAAVGTHVIGIYGSSTPAFTPPLTERSTVVYRGLACSPCFARSCPLGHTDCLNGIDVAQIVAAVESVP
jgi:heptosyltransferase-2